MIRSGIDRSPAPRDQPERTLGTAGWLVTATSGPAFWWAAAAVATLGGAAAGLHLPTSGDSFVHIATGRILEARGFLGSSSFMAGPGSPLDLRSWLLDLGLAHLYSLGGVAALEVLAALIGAATGALVLLAIRLAGRAHPVMVMICLGLALAALDPAITSLPAAVMALLAAGSLVCLMALGRGERWAPWALLAVVVTWAQVDSFLVVVAPLLALTLLFFERRRGNPRPWLLALGVVAASCLNPQGPLIYSGIPYSLGMLGEHPLLPLFSSPDFHPWGARLSELTALALLLGYLVAGKGAGRWQGLLAMATAVMALVWSAYMPLFLVVAATQSAILLSHFAHRLATDHPGQEKSTISQRSLLLAACLPVLLTVALLGRAALQAEGSGGPNGQLASLLPVAARAWLQAHPGPGVWYTTTDFGDYLAAADPLGGRLVCTSDPVADGGARMVACQELAVLNQGALQVLGRLGARTAVLPVAAPEVAFLEAEGWGIRYRDAVTVVLTAPPRVR
ncbi:MAG: hypothetical protein ACYCYK_05385 [Candidatus Dormibacteria bacterium]